MTKRSTFLIAVAGICGVLAASLLICVAQDKNAKPARGNFVPSPVFSPPYPPLPHHFSDVHTIQILCQAPKGAIKRALARPLEHNGDDVKFFDGPHDPLTFLGPINVLDAKMSISEGPMKDGLGLGEVIYEWKEYDITVGWTAPEGLSALDQN